MADIAHCIGAAAPYYNMILVIILVPLMIKLLNIKNKKLDLKPWRLLAAALGIYIIEEILTILNGLGITNTPKILPPIFEFVIITLFIYMLLAQKEDLK